MLHGLEITVPFLHAVTVLLTMRKEVVGYGMQRPKTVQVTIKNKLSAPLGMQKCDYQQFRSCSAMGKLAQGTHWRMMRPAGQKPVPSPQQ